MSLHSLSLADQQWLTAVVAVFAAALVVRQIRILVRRNEFETLQSARQSLLERFRDETSSESGFYALRMRFADDQGRNTSAEVGWGERHYRLGLARRVQAVRALSDDERAADLAVVTPLVHALNDVAALLDYGFVRPQRLLSTYHLLFIRECFIAEPYIFHEAIFGDRGRWGMRVLELGRVARRYNDMNPLHREDVYLIEGHRLDPHYGVLHPRPPKYAMARSRMLWALRRTVGYPGIKERHKRAQKRNLRRLKQALPTAPARTGRPLTWCPDVGPKRLPQLVAQLDAWTGAAALQSLVDLFGCSRPSVLEVLSK